MPIQGDKIVAPIGLATINNFLGTGEQSVTNIVVKALHGGTKVFDRTYTDPDTGDVTTVPFNTAFDLESGEIIKDAVPFWNIWSAKSPGTFFLKERNVAERDLTFKIRNLADNKDDVDADWYADLGKYDQYDRSTEPIWSFLYKATAYDTEETTYVDLRFFGRVSTFLEMLQNSYGYVDLNFGPPYKLGMDIFDRYGTKIGRYTHSDYVEGMGNGIESVGFFSQLTVELADGSGMPPYTIAPFLSKWRDGVELNYKILFSENLTGVVDTVKEVNVEILPGRPAPITIEFGTLPTPGVIDPTKLDCFMGLSGEWVGSLSGRIILSRTEDYVSDPGLGIVTPSSIDIDYQGTPISVDVSISNLSESSPIYLMYAPSSLQELPSGYINRPLQIK